MTRTALPLWLLKMIDLAICASPDFVKEMTGYEVGGVPPLGHARPCTVFLDEDLKAYPTLWAAGGTASAVFEIGFERLVEVSSAQVADVAKR